MIRKKFLIQIVALLFLILFLPKTTYGVDFNLFAPTETLQRGQTVVFTIEVDTQNESLNTTQIGASYETKYLQFLNVTPGDTFSTINADSLENGKILITGTSPSGFSGQGTFAYINFKLIATAPGSTQLCALWAPSPSPSQVQPSQTYPTNPPQLTNPPQPTALPKSGDTKTTTTATLIGAALMLAAISILVFKKHYLPITQFKKSKESKNRILTHKQNHHKT